MHDPLTRRTFVQKTGLAMLGLTVAQATRATTASPLPEAQRIQPGKTCLWYDRPATHFNDALPIGNGRIGAMVHGGTTREKLTLNEDTLWAGRSAPEPSPQARETLAAIRAQLREGNYETAQRLVEEKILTRHTQPYLPAGELLIERDFSSEPQHYRRSLDLAEGIARAEWTADGHSFFQESFASAVHQVLVLRFASETPAGFTLSLSCPLRSTATVGPDRMDLAGEAPVFAGEKGNPVLRYAQPGEDAPRRFNVGLRVLAPGARLTADADRLVIADAKEVVVYLALATTHRRADAPAQVEAWLQSALQTGYASLREAHIADHRRLFDRVQLDLGRAEKPLDHLTTDQRLTRKQSGEADPALEALLFDYGRYLLMASSRPGSQPANLQGIWNDLVHPPWWSNWTLNINLPMNYWPAEVCALPECHEPLFAWVEALRPSGEKTAAVHYGCRGWVVHHMTDLLHQTTPIAGRARYAFWVMGAAWLSRHFWEHYLYTQDQRFLQERAWPVMHGAAEFLLDWLVEDASGRLTTSPSTSPENSFLDKQGRRCSVCTGSAMDLSITRDLFVLCLQAATVLGTRSDDFSQQIEKALARLTPLQIGKRGQLQEWDKDWEEFEPAHRHVSHLFGLHPGAEITPRHTPELADAARRSLELRGPEGTGWSLAWKISLYARLGDGEQAYQFLARLFRRVEPHTTQTADVGGGLYPNLLDACPPFQIDGNFGYTAGVAELLLQSHAGDIELLPALPAAWPAGSVRGLRARGGYVVDISWREGKLSQTRIQSSVTGKTVVRYQEKLRDFSLGPYETLNLDGDLKARSGTEIS